MSPDPAIAVRPARARRTQPAWCVPDYDLHLFSEGHHWHLHRHLGAHPMSADGVDGVRFSVWAPGARRVSVVGDFNQWDGRRNVMRHRGDSGVWETFVGGIRAGQLYKYEVIGMAGERILKSDPFGREFQLRPETASVVAAESSHEWQDSAWMHARAARDWLHAPMSIYEVHLGSWRRHQDGSFLTYRQHADALIPYVRELGYTHIELLPVMEHPYDPSWGYQAIGNFAPTRRYGTPDDFRFFIDRCHLAGIGVLLDWVPAHFPKDGHGIARFDGTPLFEHADPRRSEHPDWGTLVYDYARPQVKNYLLASALHWLDEFHADGLRVDAVASMLYLDYSRKQGEWLPNRHGGRENLDAVAFLQELNTLVPQQHPGALVIAEESTAWPQVSRPTYVGGLGFSMKWDLGWMHDTLDYLQRDPVHRSHHHNRMTFGAMYRHAENFVLPLSHDEVVHGKRSLLHKMPGDRWQQFANLRLLHAYQATYPGKKLMFMGGEFGQRSEWNHDAALDWDALQDPLHRGLYRLVRDLNRAYAQQPALHRFDFEPRGFEWTDCHDSAQSVLCFRRNAGHEFVLVALNFTPVPRHGYRLGVPVGGAFEEIINTDSAFYGGSNCGNQGLIQAEAFPWMNQPFSLRLTLPPLAAVLLRPKSSISPSA